MPRLIERSEAGWHLTIDASHAPDYVLVTTIGAGSDENVAVSAEAIVLVMNEVVGPRGRFCPIINDIRRWTPGTITIPHFQKTFRAIFPRVSRLVNVMATQTRPAYVVYVLLEIASAYVGGMDVVSTMEDALAKLGLPTDRP